MRQSKYNSIVIVVVLVLFRMTLDIVYKNTISPLYSYQNFVLHFNSSKYLFSWIWVACIAAYDIILLKDDRPSSNFLFFTDLLFFIPLTSISCLANFNVSFIIYSFVYWVLMGIIHLSRLRYKSFSYRDNSTRGNYIFFVIVISLLFINTISTVHYNGFHIKFDLANVYDIRINVREMDIPSVFEYIKSWATHITLILVVLFMQRKNYIVVAALSVLQLMNYSFGAMKTDLFLLFVALAIGALYNSKRKLYILYAFLALNFIALLEFKIRGASSLSYILQRRLLYMPALLSSEYFNFFSNNELVFFRDSFMRWLGFENPYGVGIPRLIGDLIHNSADMNANTGILGDDFAQLGWMSLLFYPLLRVKLLHYGLDNMGSGVSSRVMAFVSFSYALSFISGSFFMVILTGGFALVCYLLFNINRKNKPQLLY